MKKYINLIRQYSKDSYKKISREARGLLAHPFIVPGANYAYDLWDWDSYWTAYALIQAFQTYDEEVLKEVGLTKEKVLKVGQGCVQNFLNEFDGVVFKSFEQFGEHNHHLPLTMFLMVDG